MINESIDGELVILTLEALGIVNNEDFFVKLVSL